MKIAQQNYADRSKKYFTCFILTLFFGCSQNDTIKREIKLQEARKGYELLDISITREKNLNDTSAVYFNATIKTGEKDSVINDSIFFVKNNDDVLLPFSSNPQNGNK